jgi:hypothetical protein
VAADAATADVAAYCIAPGSISSSTGEARSYSTKLNILKESQGVNLLGESASGGSTKKVARFF